MVSFYLAKQNILFCLDKSFGFYVESYFFCSNNLDGFRCIRIRKNQYWLFWALVFNINQCSLKTICLSLNPLRFFIQKWWIHYKNVSCFKVFHVCYEQYCRIWLFYDNLCFTRWASKWPKICIQILKWPKKGVILGSMYIDNVDADKGCLTSCFQLLHILLSGRYDSMLKSSFSSLLSALLMVLFIWSI